MCHHPPVVCVADAVVDPGAVVVHLLHAAPALAAVVRPGHLEATAHLKQIRTQHQGFYFATVESDARELFPNFDQHRGTPT